MEWILPDVHCGAIRLGLVDFWGTKLGGAAQSVQRTIQWCRHAYQPKIRYHSCPVAQQNVFRFKVAVNQPPAAATQALAAILSCPTQ